MRVLAINDISCVGKCSLTVALPIISASGVTCDILPTAILSTHTGGFSGYTFRDLSEDIPRYARTVENARLTIRYHHKRLSRQHQSDRNGKSHQKRFFERGRTDDRRSRNGRQRRALFAFRSKICRGNEGTLPHRRRDRSQPYRSVLFDRYSFCLCHGKRLPRHFG